MSATHAIIEKITNQTPQIIELLPSLTSDQILSTINYSNLTVQDIQRVSDLRKSLNSKDPNTLIMFSSSEQNKLNEMSAEAISEAKSKDLGPVGDAMVEMSTKMRGLDVSSLKNSNKKPGFFGKLLGKVEPVAKFIEQYEYVSSQLELARSKLTGGKIEMLKSIERLSIRYDATLGFYHVIGIYILALKEELNDLEQNQLPKLREIAQQSNSDLMATQDVTDLESYKHDIERKITDLLITRQLAQQRIVATRISQNNSKALVNKIQNQLTNVLSCWQEQIALAIDMAKNKNIAELTKTVDDASDAIILQGARLLRQGTALVQQQINRPITSLEIITSANEELIGTINDIQEFVKQGEVNRKILEKGIVENEIKLKKTLLEQAGKNPVLLPIEGKIIDDNNRNDSSSRKI